MIPGQKSKTFADYLAIAVSPALIMVLVGSLCFFLIEVFDRGAGAASMRWLMFWFVLAVVLIARIGIEQGAAHAFVYGAALASVTWLYTLMSQPNFVLSAVLLAVVWYSAYKLTWNCTLIDEDDDASGQGLMEVVRSEAAKVRAGKEARSAAAEEEDAVKAPAPPLTAKAKRQQKIKKLAAAQTPGIWVIYFSLAALPLFGLGQNLLPAGDLNARRQGFDYLFFYMAAALGLLLTTSFLGLRRYLRQRLLPMPGYVAVSWMRLGVMAAVLVLGGALLLPRPGATEAWSRLRYQVDYRLRQASEYAARFNPPGKGQGRAGEQSGPKGKEGESTETSGQTPETEQGKATATDEQAKQKTGGGQQSGEQPEPNQQPSGQEQTQSTPAGMPQLSAAAAPIYQWLKKLFWAAAIVLGIWLVFFRYRAAIWQALQNIWAGILKFFNDLLGMFQPSTTSVAAAPAPAKVVPFKRFKNPFLTGSDRVWPPEQLIIYSYDALQSWAREQTAPAESPQTPRELCEQLGEEIPDVHVELNHLAYLYGNVVYGGSLPSGYDPEKLRRIWSYLASPHRRQQTNA